VGVRKEERKEYIEAQSEESGRVSNRSQAAVIVVYIARKKDARVSQLKTPDSKNVMYERVMRSL